MTTKGNTLTRRPVPQIKTTTLLTSAPLMRMMMEKFKSTNKVPFNYTALFRCIETNRETTEEFGYLSAGYLCRMITLDCELTRPKAASVARYLSIPVESIAISAFNQRSHSSRLKPHGKPEGTLTKYESLQESFNRMATLFITQNYHNNEVL